MASAECGLASQGLSLAAPSPPALSVVPFAALWCPGRWAPDKPQPGAGEGPARWLFRDWEEELTARAAPSTWPVLTAARCRRCCCCSSPGKLRPRARVSAGDGVLGRPPRVGGTAGTTPGRPRGPTDAVEKRRGRAPLTPAGFRAQLPHCPKRERGLQPTRVEGGAAGGRGAGRGAAGGAGRAPGCMHIKAAAGRREPGERRRGTGGAAAGAKPELSRSPSGAPGPFCAPLGPLPAHHPSAQ